MLPVGLLGFLLDIIVYTGGLAYSIKHFTVELWLNNGKLYRHIKFITHG